MILVPPLAPATATTRPFEDVSGHRFEDWEPHFEMNILKYCLAGDIFQNDAHCDWESLQQATSSAPVN